MSEITELLRGGKTGSDKPDLQAVFDRLYPELKKLARARLAVMSSGETLTPTALVHEAFDRLVQAQNLDLQGRRHFFACAGRVMRYIIIDHLRMAGSQKRGGDQVAVTLTEAIAGEDDLPQLLDLDRALDELDQINPLQRELVEMRFFAGLPMTEIADLLGLSSRTAGREWQRARAFLHTRVAETSSIRGRHPNC